MMARQVKTNALRIVFYLTLITSATMAASSASPNSTADSGSDKKTALKPYALIFGTVYGKDQRPVAGVTVKIRRASDKKPKWERYSDSHGEFAQRVPAGAADYVVWAQVKGIRQVYENTEVKVHVDNDERRDVSLHLID